MALKPKKVKTTKKLEHSQGEIGFIVCNFCADYKTQNYGNQAKIADELLKKYPISFWKFLLEKSKIYSDWKTPTSLVYFKSEYGKTLLCKEFVKFQLVLPPMPRNKVGTERIEPIKILPKQKPKNIYQFIKYGEEKE